MIADPTCPLCDAEDWQHLGTKRYQRRDAVTCSPTIQRRLNVLWNVWCPCDDEVEITSVLCTQCGFVIYAPRPTEKDLIEKYRYLVQMGPDPDAQATTDEYTESRVQFLMQQLKRHIPSNNTTPLRVLDYGGGDGRLTRDLVRQGHHCHVVDFITETEPSVTKLSDQLEDLPADTQPFDLIIASHVFEHLADPLKIATRLSELLCSNGYLYAEVPMEIWQKPPLQEDPVTHVNFFTARSMMSLLRRAGMHPISCRTTGIELPSKDGNIHRACVVRAIARPAKQSLPLARGGAEMVRQLLAPNLATKVWWATKHPGVLGRSIWNRLCGQSARI